ncbi:TetR/AcrR family transcriptional regulator [Sandaracinobacteroides saxicola]|uniref:TetR/AcrR family transcriptional regulator n=1 Tax=Sandaracinobacteroides saxicola TaxID=2759707 RepID=A0A7G5II35_9SPHN|nr:TetR/AcrR family transcriptional regulator [Sandaracinobacteroides saxicola]QMW23027.1 TetR/AcrR family transcriptional regulator [Sandaracinobacteroides saxicola]
MSSRTAPSARTALLDAAVRLIRKQGFAATSVDALCAAAGVTKGAFFHHFASKEALGVAAADHWSQTTGALFAAAPYHDAADPLARLFAYLDFRAGLIAGTAAEFSCVAGTMVQEVHESSPAIRAACGASITGHADTLVPDITAALAAHGVTGVDPHDLALHTQAVLQGGFILAKATGDPSQALGSIAHLKRYIAMLCGVAASSEGA